MTLFFRSSHSNEKQLLLCTEGSAETQGDDTYSVYHNPRSSFLLRCPFHDVSQASARAHLVRGS